MSSTVEVVELTTGTAGGNATQRFMSRAFANEVGTPPERVSSMARELLNAVHDIVRSHKMSYA